MGIKLWRLVLDACIAVQLLLLCSCGSAQVPTGFVSIDCGLSSTSPYNDTNSIEWSSDADLTTEGESVTVGGFFRPFNTMRLFKGNHSKYCYRLSNSAVIPGAFFLLRASFWMGSPPPFSPKSSDGFFHFKLLIDADEWQDVNLNASDSSHWTFFEIYTRALRNSIDVCLARSAPNGDDPFISALELRPLPSSLSATRLMNDTNRNFISITREDAGSVTGSTSRYPSDSLDRFWQSNTAGPVLATMAPIDTSNSQPVNVLQTAFGGTADIVSYVTWTYSNRDVNGVYYCLIYFAEIDPRVNASGQRVFNIVLNGETLVNAKPIDVFGEVGANTSYEIITDAISADKQRGSISFNFSATSTSRFSPFFAATELFQASTKAFSNGSSSNDMMAIDDLKASMSLSSYTGDPCLPIGFAYSWLTCTTGVPRITSISLSNYFTGGQIPETINTLTMLEKILLNGNNLEGSIPNMSDLTNLRTLDLSNNKLNGFIPDSLATLKKLTSLNLSNNNLIGEIPAALLQRQQESTLDFDFSGNPLCENSNVSCTLPPPSSSSKSKNNIGLIVGVIIAVIFVVMIGVALTLFYLRKNKYHSTLHQSLSNRSPTQAEIPLYPSSKPSSNSVIKKPLPMLSIQEFTYQEIECATNNFNTQIGKGGFGPVYKGSLKNGGIVAIKVSSNSSHQGSKEFLNEVDLLSRIHHKNLVGLLGFCNEGKLILVYEFMSKGSLFDCLHGEIAKDSPLSWSTRLRILVDAAQGFDYLHYGCDPRIIHRDIKSSNILLNDKLEAKISDFGISRSSFICESGAPSTALMGSMGYLDPEYLSTMRLTEKVDVYSFGVLIFEVLCGRTAVFMDASKKQTHIVEWIRPYIDRGVIDDVIDVALHGDFNISSVWKVLDVALACVEFSSDQRPNMSVIYSELKEAQRMNLERDQSDMFNIPLPTTTFRENDYDSLSLTHVHPR